MVSKTTTSLGYQSLQTLGLGRFKGGGRRLWTGVTGGVRFLFRACGSSGEGYMV